MFNPIPVLLLMTIASLTWAAASFALPLSPGDRLKLSIPEGEEFNGIYEVNLEGKLEIPYLPPLPAAGLDSQQVQRNLTQALLQGRLFQPNFLRVSLNVVQWAPIQVYVSGATYVPGRVLINEQSDAQQTQPPVPLTGQYPPRRFLAVALREAGGIRPTADITAIQLIRQGQTRSFDLSGVLTGEPVEDVPLIAGDRIIVPDTGQINNALVRPSQITPIGVKIFLSNLTVPATGNAISGISRDATSFPYGSRFSQAVVAANCAGGTRGTNAGRRALLVTTDQMTGKTSYLERKVNDILQDSNSNADNPYLMANDAVVCYDSNFVQFRDIMQSLSQFVFPIPLIRGLIP